MQFILYCYKAQEMFVKAVNRSFLAFSYISGRYKTQEMCENVISEDTFILVYSPDIYKTQKMCDEAVGDSVGALKFIPDWFVTSKMIKTLLLFYAQMIIYSILTKILVMSYFFVMKWIFLV